MKKYEILQNISNDANGVLRTSDAAAYGISKTYFLEFVRKHGFEKVNHGIYLAPDAWEDSMYILQCRFKNIVFSHETALYLLDMTDREPFNYEVTVCRGYNPGVLSENGLKPYTIKKELFSLGIIKMESPMGNPVKVYNAERTICDILRTGSMIEVQDRQTALKEYFKRDNRDIPLLMEYAKKFKVEKVLKPYLEILL